MKKIFCLAGLALAFFANVNAAQEFQNGIFVLNEDWFGHNSSTINFYSYDTGEMTYRAYQAVNPGLTLGNTSQFAELGSENLFICSKQNYGTTGGRFIVADAKTLKSKKSFETVGSGDTRAYLSISDKKGYIGATDGVHPYDITTGTIGDAVEGTAGAAYSSQPGDMVFSNGQLLVAVQGKGLYVINTANDRLQKTVSIDNIASVFTVGGSILVSVNDCTYGVPSASNVAQFVLLDANTFEPKSTMTAPMVSQNTWFAWKHAAPAVDEKNMVLYYSPGENTNYICKYDLKSQTFTQNFITFDDGQAMYGSVVGYDPDNNYVVAATFENYSSQNYYLNIYNATDGSKVKSFKLADNYWFPAMLLFAPKKTVTGVADNVAEKTVESVKYYNLAGVESAEPFSGINIVVTRYTDGTTTSAKKVVR